MADFYFFTDIDQIENQATANSMSLGAREGISFGPTNSGNYYQLSNLHYPKPGNNPAAYAICTGQLFCVEVPASNGAFDINADPELVNLILKPDTQPENCPHVKYYIYRSILKKSLVGLTGFVIDDNDSLSNDLTKQINKDQNSPVEGIVFGLPFDVSDLIDDETYIDDIFTKSSLKNKSLRSVKSGTCVGYFPKNSSFPGHDTLRYFGMEIMLDSLGFNPKLKDIRQQFPSYSNTGFHLGNSNIKKFTDNSIIGKNDKEYVLNFMDPAAFYGNFYETILKGSDSLWIKGETSAIKADDLYNKILIGNSKPTNGMSNIEKNTNAGIERERLFRNSNRIYLDIRNEFNFSLNYFGEFSTNAIAEDLKVRWIHKTDGTNYEKIFLKSEHRNDYPILMFEKDSNNIIGLPNRYKIIIGRDDKTRPGNPNANDYQRYDSIKLKLKFQKNSLTAYYTAYVNTGKTTEKNSGGGKFKNINTLATDSDDADFKNYTNSIDIDIYHYENNLLSSAGNLDANVNHCIARYIKIIIIKHESDVKSAYLPSPSSLKSFEYLDNVFLPFEQVINFKDQTKINSKVYHEAAYVNNIQVDGTDFMADIGIAKDVNGDITLFAIAHEFRNAEDNGSATVRKNKITSQVITPASLESTYLFEFSKLTNSLYETMPADDSNVNFKVQNVTDIEDPTDNFNRPIKGFAAITISAQDFQSIKNKYVQNIASNALLEGFKTFLGFKFISATHQSAKYEILIRGFMDIAGRLTISEVFSGIYHYIRYPSIDLNRKQIPGPHAYEVIDLPSGGFFVAQQQIHCNVFFLKGLNTSNVELNNYIEYFITDIKNIWNSEINKGIEKAAAESIPGSIINADNVAPFIATPYHLSRLNKNSIVALVQRSSKRSSAGRNTMMLYFNNGLSDHTAAHEFGHIMGLGDRYCYMGIVYQGKERDHNNNYIELAASTVRKRVLRRSGIGVSLYLPPGIDDDYSKNYGWYYNLFSTIREVPSSILGEPFKNEPAFSTFHNIYKPTSGTITLFITPNQWAIVKNQGREGSHFGDKVAFFRNIDYPTPLPSGPLSSVLTSFRGTFLGQQAVFGQVSTDDTFATASGQSAPDMNNRLVTQNLNSLYDGQFAELGGDFIEIVNDRKKLEDIKTGGLETSRKRIILNRDNPEDLNLTGMGDRFLIPPSSIGTGDNAGISSWNDESEKNQTFKANEGTPKEKAIIYDNHSNREAIVITIGMGSGPS